MPEQTAPLSNACNFALSTLFDGNLTPKELACLVRNYGGKLEEPATFRFSDGSRAIWAQEGAWIIKN